MQSSSVSQRSNKFFDNSVIIAVKDGMFSFVLGLVVGHVESVDFKFYVDSIIPCLKNMSIFIHLAFYLLESLL